MESSWTRKQTVHIFMTLAMKLQQHTVFHFVFTINHNHFSFQLIFHLCSSSLESHLINRPLKHCLIIFLNHFSSAYESTLQHMKATSFLHSFPLTYFKNLELRKDLFLPTFSSVSRGGRYFNSRQTWKIAQTIQISNSSDWKMCKIQHPTDRMKYGWNRMKIRRNN